MNNQLNSPESNEVSNVKRGRGRPKGSNSFAHVQIKQLLNMLSEEAVIPVSSIWLRNTLGLAVEAPVVRTITNHQTPIIEDQTEEKVEFHVENFEESNCPF
jgi:hypothetical protein